MKKLLIATLMAAAGWLGAAVSAQAAVLSIQQATSTTTVGGIVTVDLVISGLDADNEIVSGFDLDVFFDPAVLGVASLTTVFAPWGSLGDLLLDQNFVAPGHVEFILTAFNDDATLAGLQGDSFTLSSITFSGLADGFSLVNFGADLNFERNVVGRNANSLPLTVQGACIAVGTGTCDQKVPEPATLALVLLGLAAAAVTRRRTRG